MQRLSSPGGTCRAAPCTSARCTSGGKRMTTHRLLRSSTSSRRTGTTVGSTSGQTLAKSGSTPVCGVSTVVNTTCKRSRLRASNAAPEYLAGRQAPSLCQHCSSDALKVQLQVRRGELVRGRRLRACAAERGWRVRQATERANLLKQCRLASRKRQSASAAAVRKSRAESAPAQQRALCPARA